MANQTSDNNNNDSNNNITPSGSSSSQVNEQTTIPKANSVNQNVNPNLDLSRGFNNKNYSPMGPNNNLDQNNNLALGQKKPNRNSDLDKPNLYDKDEKDDKSKNDSNKQQPHNDSPSSKTDSKSTDSNNNNNKLMHNSDNNINNSNNAYNPNNANKIGNDDSDTDSNKFRKNDNQNTNREAAKQVTNNNSNDTESENNDDGKTNFNLLNNAFLRNPVIRIKVIIAGSIIVGVVIGTLLLISILNAIIASVSSSMCGNGSLGSSYSGSGDVLEFMCGMQSPVENYTVTSKFGYDVDDVHAGRLHSGIDLAVSTGTPVYAAQGGTVIGTDTSSGYGHDVVIDHGGGIFTRFAHNSKLLVKKGDIVSKGQQIAEAGSTGHSTGPHGHFEIMKTTEDAIFSGYQDPNDYFVDHDNFMKSCGSSAGASYVSTSSVTTTVVEQEPYESLKVLKTLSRDTGTIKYISRTKGLTFQSFAYNNGDYYLQAIHSGQYGSDGYIYKYNSNLELVDKSPKEQGLLHGNGLAYSTADNKLYSVSTKYVGNNTHTRIIDSDSLKIIENKKLLKRAAAIGYDRLTNRFVTGLKVEDVYVYNSTLSDYAGKGHITKIRTGNHPGDVGAYGGIIYITTFEYVGNNHIDMYNEDTGEYLGSYEAPYAEIEGVDVDNKGELVLLFNAQRPFLQFTGIKANVINGTSDAVDSQGGDQCCVNGSSTTYTSTSGDYCPNGITVTGDYAGTYDLDDYIEKVVTAENGGAHPEALKALAIAARTYALNRTDNCKNSIENSTAAQVMAEEASDRVKEALANVKGSIMLYNGNYFSAQYSSFYGKCDGTQCTGTFIKTPSEEKATFTMPYTYLTTAPTAGHEYGLSQNGSHYMATVQGKTYDEILKFFYAEGIEITGSQSSGGSCSLGGDGTYQNGKIWDYNQADYSDPYCGGTIADSGCGPTAMAMVVSTFLNEKHDPPELAKVTTDTGLCSTETHDYFKKAAEKYNLTYQKLGSDSAEEVMTALNRGDSLVIANVTNATVDGLDNFWTEGGHYIVLAGHDGRDVWVQDPNKGMESVHRTNTKGDGVYNFDKYIKPAATLGYMIFKKA